MNRRRLLATGGDAVIGVVGLAGCSSSPPRSDAGGPGGGDDPPDTTIPTPIDTSTPTPEPPSLVVSISSLAPAVVVMTSPDSIGASRAEGFQFLTLEVSVESGDPPAAGDFHVRFGGREYPPLPTQPASAERRLYRAYNDREGSYDAEAGAGWLVFELPASGDASDAALTWPGGAMALEGATATGDPLRSRLERLPPTLSATFAAPETASPGTNPTVSFEASNEDEVGTRFVAGLNRSGPRIAHAPIEAVSRPVPAGATETFEVTDRFDLPDAGDAVGDEKPDFTYHLDWTGGSASRDVRLVE